LKGLQACMGDYAHVLKPNSRTLMRGMNIEMSKMKRLLRNYKSDHLLGFLENEGKTLEKVHAEVFSMIDSSFKYKPMREIESWTTDVKRAMEFSKAWEGSNNSIIVKATFPKNDLLFNTKFTNTISWAEYEILRISNKTVTCELYIQPKTIKRILVDTV